MVFPTESLLCGVMQYLRMLWINNKPLLSCRVQGSSCSRLFCWLYRVLLVHGIFFSNSVLAFPVGCSYFLTSTLILYSETSGTFSVWCQLASQSHIGVWMCEEWCYSSWLHTLTYVKRRWLVRFIAQCKLSIWWNGEKHNDWPYTGQEFIAPYSVKNANWWNVEILTWGKKS